MTNGHHIISELKTIVESLGDVYLNIADKYPGLMRMLEQKIAQMKDDSTGKESLSDMHYHVQRINQTVTDQEKKLNDLTSRDNVFLNRISERLNTVKELDRNIDQIEDDSAELELISLNAMVTALKAGKNGGAFPYITEELQKVSKSSAKLSNGLKTKGRDLNNYFEIFQSSINEEKSNINESIHAMVNDFEELTRTTSKYQSISSSLIEKFSTEVADIKKPFYLILEEVQKHDIVRQSVDHVVLAIDHIKPPQDSSIEGRLESLSYASRVYGFCNEILTEIYTELNKTYKTFCDKSEGLNSLILYLQYQGNELRNCSGNKSCRDHIVEIQESIAVNLDKIKKESVQKYIQKALENIDREINNLEDAYNGFSRIISWVKTINISSRVEAAKLPHLENMTYIIENITDRTGSIEKSVDIIIHTISDFRKHMDSLFQNYFTLASKDSDQLEQFADDLKENLLHINTYSISLDRKMTDMLATGDDFINLNKMTAKDLQKMENLIAGIKGIIKEVEEEKAKTDADLERNLKEAGISNWQLKGDEIKKLIDKFTIYIHKKKVDTGNALEMDAEGASSGEVTLF